MINNIQELVNVILTILCTYYIVNNIMDFNLFKNIFPNNQLNTEDIINNFKNIIPSKSNSEQFNNTNINSKHEMLNYINDIIDDDIKSSLDDKSNKTTSSNNYIKSNITKFISNMIPKSTQIEQFSTINDADISSNYVEELFEVGDKIKDNNDGTSLYSNEKCQNGGSFGETIGYNSDDANYLQL